MGNDGGTSFSVVLCTAASSMPRPAATRAAKGIFTSSPVGGQISFFFQKKTAGLGVSCALGVSVGCSSPWSLVGWVGVGCLPQPTQVTSPEFTPNLPPPPGVENVRPWWGTGLARLDFHGTGGSLGGKKCARWVQPPTPEGRHPQAYGKA